MKISLLALCSALLLTACAGMRVTHVEVATGAAHPSAIYIRPFAIEYATYRNPSTKDGQAIRKSLAPIEFADDLQEELAKLAPTRVLRPNEFPKEGWLVEGEFELVDAGHPTERSTIAGFSGQGRSRLRLHVRVIDLGNGGGGAVADAKDGVAVSRGIKTRRGLVIYEFDVAGGSHCSGRLGSVYAPGTGDAIPFDFRNAAERIMLTLSPDPFRYGYRSSPVPE